MKNLLTIILFFITLTMNAQTKPTASGLVPVNGINVYYETYGTGKPLVLIHGAFMTIESNWGQLVPELSKTRKVIAIEMQGHGHSPYSDRKLNFVTLASDVEGVMDYLKIDNADVAGFSFGGSIAYQLAMKSPKRVNNLVIISAAYKSACWLPEINDAFKGMKPELFANSPMQTAYEAVAPDKSKWNKFLENMISFAGTPYDMGDANLAKITAPVLIIAGDNDGLDKVELAKTYKLLGGDKIGDMGQMPKSKLAIVPGQGHVSVVMQTETLVKYMNEFLK